VVSFGGATPARSRHLSASLLVLADCWFSLFLDSEGGGSYVHPKLQLTSFELHSLTWRKMPSHSHCFENLKSYEYGKRKKIPVIWDIIPFSPLKIKRRFERTRCLLFSGSKIKPRKKPGPKICLILALFLFHVWLILLPWRLRRHSSETSAFTRRYIPVDRTLHKPPLWEPQILHEQKNL
jgi:hypothetical protein